MRMTNRMQEENGMYHCHIHFYLAGRQKRLFEYIKGMPPLEHFTHSFIESDTPQEALAARADVILADLHGIDAKDALRILTFGKVREAELILLADKEQTMALKEELAQVRAYADSFKEQVKQMLEQRAEGIEAEAGNGVEMEHPTRVMPDNEGHFEVGTGIDGDRDELPL